jgi:hypothetical protein
VLVFGKAVLHGLQSIAIIQVHLGLALILVQQGREHNGSAILLIEIANSRPTLGAELPLDPFG